MALAPASSTDIIKPGRNCWRSARANRFRSVQDAAEYFQLVRDAILRARHTVFILGWDIAAFTDLLPGGAPTGEPTRLDRLLGYVARRRHDLRCYVLIWDYGSLYTLERDPFTRLRFGLRTPRRVKFGFDDRHPVGASHHQKIVVVDDALAFCGGIDLTSHRWDTTAHRVEEPNRTSGGRPYGPYHEVQAMVDGPAAESLGELARERWQALGVRTAPVAAPGDAVWATAGSADDMWPADVEPDLTDVDVAIARTVPPSGDRPAIRECEALFLDSIAAAKSSIYIESQYFTNKRLSAALKARLAEPDGPEVIVITPRECHGWLEQQTIGALRGEVLRDIVSADPHGRLRLVYPLASRAHDCATFVHSKVMVVDDEFARIGSANFSHRSMGVDTECDLAVAANGEPRRQAAIRRMRDRLLAEHLGMQPEAVGPLLDRTGSLRGLIDACGDQDRCLARIDLAREASEAPSDTVRAATDPDEPIDFGSNVDQLIPAVEATRGRGPLRIWVLPVAILAAAFAITWASSGTIRRSGLGAVAGLLQPLPDATLPLVMGFAVFILASLVLLPLELLAIGCGLFFGPLRGSLVAATASVVAALIGYAAGRALGPARVADWVSQHAFRSGRQTTAHGVRGVAVFRLAGVGSAGAASLLCGAAGVRLITFLAGTVVALTPLVIALAALGALLRNTILHPSLQNGALAIVAALLLIAAAAALRTLFLIRQFAPAVSRQRRRAEFG